MSTDTDTGQEFNHFNGIPLRTVQRYGWKKDYSNHEHLKMSWQQCHHDKKQNITKIDLCDEYMPPIYNQGNLGSCTANAIAAIYERKYNWNLKNAFTNVNEPEFTSSRLFIYYNERLVEGTVNMDSGATISDGMEVINKIGICQERDYPYIIADFTNQPSSEAYENASYFKTFGYRKIELDDIKTSLVNGYCVAIGFSVQTSFESSSVKNTGNYNPDKLEKVIGGHAVVICGFDDNYEPGDSKGAFKVRNSWGSQWGQNGYFWVSYDHVLNGGLWSDAWIILSEIDPEGVDNPKLVK